MVDSRLDDPGWLREKYHGEGLTLAEIGELVGSSDATVLRRINGFGIETRDTSYKTPERRFWETVDRGDPEECWEWTNNTSAGYGSIMVDGKNILAHRFSYKLHFGDPGEKWVLHKCDNKPCVNPDHLYAGTPSDNLNDAWERGQMDPDFPVGEENHSSKLTEDEVCEIKRKLKKKNMTYAEIGDEYGVAITTISDIASGRNWGHVKIGGDE